MYLLNLSHNVKEISCHDMNMQFYPLFVFEPTLFLLWNISGDFCHQEAILYVRLLMSIQFYLLCQLSENDLQRLKDEMKAKCETCGKILRDRTKLNQHIKFIHNLIKRFKCNLCDHLDSRKDNMKTHMKNNHKEPEFASSYSVLSDVTA